MTDEVEQTEPRRQSGSLGRSWRRRWSSPASAGELTLGYFRSVGLAVDWKSDGTPVTQADRRAERLIREELELRHPGDGILGEEEGEKPSETGRRWIVDPIDGTKAFTHGVGLYVNLLALEDERGHRPRGDQRAARSARPSTRRGASAATTTAPPPR